MSNVPSSAVPSVRTLRLVMAALLLAVALPPAPAAAARGPKTGPYVTTFAERSPSSRPKALAARMSLAAEPADYDLTAEEFLVAVPDAYDPDKPAGILYLINYKDAANFPSQEVLDALKKRNLIFAMSKTSKQPVPTKVGLALDVVQNLKRRYEVDPNRVYVFDFDVVGLPTEAGGTAGYWLALGSAEVFTGSYHHQQPLPWLPSRASNGGTFPATSAVPPDASLAAAKSHPFVMTKAGDQEWHQIRADFLKQAGFAHTKLLPVSVEQCHYPNYTLDWFEETLAFLDEHAPKAGAAVPPAPAGTALPSPDGVAAPPTTPATPAAKTGSFTTTFAVRSPLSAPKSLAARMSQPKPPPDYDLSKEEFLVYVPEDYAPAKPPGIVFLLNYKLSGDLPTPVLPVFKRRGLIFVVAKNADQTPATKVGLGLDVVHNLRQRYAVDAGRVYVFDFDTTGWGDKGGTAGQWLATGSADVFTGSFHKEPYNIWRPVRAANGGTWPVRALPPPAASFAVARTHPMVMCKAEVDPGHEMGINFVQQQGFRSLKVVTLTREQVHYPNYTADWMEETLAYLDEHPPAAGPAKPGAAIRPASAPAGSAKPAGTAR